MQNVACTYILDNGVETEKKWTLHVYNVDEKNVTIHRLQSYQAFQTQIKLTLHPSFNHASIRCCLTYVPLGESVLESGVLDAYEYEGTGQRLRPS